MFYDNRDHFEYYNAFLAHSREENVLFEFIKDINNFFFSQHTIYNYYDHDNVLRNIRALPQDMFDALYAFV